MPEEWTLRDKIYYILESKNQDLTCGNILDFEEKRRMEIYIL
jgi:hypothetical protein